MFLCAVNFGFRRFGLAALALLGLSASAQQTIQFSKPVDTDPAGKANDFMPASSRHNSAGAFNAPTSLFGGKDPVASFDILPGSPRPAVSPADAAQWRKAQEENKYWTLSTPELILNIPTAESILGIADPNEDPKLSQTERYLQRNQRQSAISVSNAMRHAETPIWHTDEKSGGPFHSVDDRNRPPGSSENSVSGVAGRNLNPLFGSRPGLADANQRLGSAWTSPFDSPEPLAKPTPAQLEGIKNFRAILAGPAFEKPPQTAGYGLPPVAAPDPNMQVMPAFNPAGRSFTGLGNDIGKPTGLTPLSGVTGPVAKPKKAAPVVQAPPWMQTSLQSGNMPQRQF